jgi:YD repeat-containing protein
MLIDIMGTTALAVDRVRDTRIPTRTEVQHWPVQQYYDAAGKRKLTVVAALAKRQ